MKIQFLLFLTIINLILMLNLNAEIEKPDIILIDTIGYEQNFCQTRMLKFLDSLNGYRVIEKGNLSNYGFILQKTSNGGTKWDNIFIDTAWSSVIDGKKYLYLPLKFNQIHIYKSGKITLFCSKVINYQNDELYDYAEILTTTNEGKNWDRQKFDSLNEVDYLYLDDCPIVKLEFFKTKGDKPLLQNKYYTSLDCGLSWQLIQFPDTMLDKKYGDFQLVDSNTIFVKFGIENSEYLSQWLQFPFLYKIREKEWYELAIPKSYLSAIRPLFFRTASDISAIFNVKYVGDNKYKDWDTYLVRSINGGKTWDTLIDMKEFTDYSSGLSNVIYFDSLNIVAYGYKYDLIKSTDGGKTWRHLYHRLGTNKDMSELSFDPNQDQNLMKKYLNYSHFMYASWPQKNHLWIMSTGFPFAPSYLFKYIEYPDNIDNYQDLQVPFLYPNPSRSTTRLNLQQEGQVAITAVDLLGR
ncbi:MAG: WD40/YVTN/BNR-like repeat-containing protein, partial [Candidatus Kapaibacteriota bacterium]